MDVRLFSYSLPPSRIAQEAVEPRDAARLLVLHRESGVVSHHVVHDLPELLSPGDLVVWNDTRVVPARVYGAKKTGGRVELLFLERRGVRETGEEWRVLLGASRAPKAGTDITLPGGVEARVIEGPDAGGSAVVRAPGPVDDLLRRHGRAPLPPYIRRAPDDPRDARDRERYQTVFAAKDGAVAAPTAGLHFTPELIARLQERGIERAAVTLHVGEGTFRPVTARSTDEIVLPPETF